MDNEYDEGSQEQIVLEKDTDDHHLTNLTKRRMKGLTTKKR